MSSVNYENQILNAIETLVNNAVSKAEYDKTIKGIIVKCVDESQNKYVVKYQDSTFYAYANEGQSIFPDGTLVYILIPGNDMTQRKSIIDSVTNLGEDYIDVVESNDRYDVIGNNIINSVNSFDLCSYTPQGQELVLYDKADEAHAAIDVNKIAADAYLKKANYLTIGADFRTNLNKEQKAKGRYGIIFNLKFIDNNSGEDVIRTYILDTNNMLGNPYNYTENVNRKLSFEIDGKNFKSIEKISIFEYDFPNTDQSITTKDIFISNLSLEAAEMYTEDEILGYSLSFRTPQGIYFDDNDLDTAERRIETIVKVKNKKVNENSDLVQYYWFRENNSININSLNYNRYGGNGWECLNNYNIVGKDENDNDLKEWLSGNYYYTTIKSANVAKENTYKCVVVYRGNIFIEKQFTIYNFSSDYEITIESDSGTYFYYDVGHPTLTCYVNGEIPTTGNWRYDWSVIDNNNQYNWLPQTATDTGMRVVDNVIYDLQLSTIINFSIYKCSVYKNNVYVGKATITITNDRNVDKNTYTLVITNGDQIFKYNERGIAPNNKSLENPQMIYPLSFVLYDELGHEVDFDSIPTKDIFWTIPTTDTMLKASTVHGNPYSVDNDNHTATYNYYSTFYFDISTLYYAQKTRNTIQLLIKYKDKIATAQTSLSFLKEGENGSNGTDFICKIVPNVADSNLINIYPTVFYKGSENPSLNFTPLSSSVWFKIQFYHDGEKIYDGTTSGNSDENKRVNIKWEILKNKYDNNKIDYSNYTIDETTGAITFNPLAAAAGDTADETKRKNNPSNIIKCTITYDNQTYYATMPIITVFSIDNYKSELVMNTGFRYAMYTTDGILPIYDNTNPFEIKVINGEIDITNDSTLSYNWSTRGLVYNNAWNEQVNLIEKRRMPSYTNNQNNYKPIDEFNGFCVNNAVVCSVIKNSSEIVKIHIPVQLYLNRFGNNAMNTWDGNHIEINNDGGFILAPQVGAGDKDSNNRFTGVFMGKVQESGKTNPEHGLYGYHQGARTIALNAEDGSARFGKAGKGQIVLDPTDDTAVLRSGNYVAPILDQSGNIITPGSGLEIDLTDPHITFGSGDFRVDKDGQVYAAGFATISKLENGDYTIPQSSIENLTTFITETTNDLQDLQEQIDGNITTWFYAYVPTLSNEPASLWTTPQEKNNHLGDLFYNTTTGYCYRFMKDVNNNYSWQKISDSDISAALEVAQQAQDTADHKRRVFYETPVPPYDAGDLWVQGSNGDIKRCATPKTEQQTYNANDWVLASKYTDDTTLNNLKSNLVSSTLVEYALGDTTTTAPTTGWSTSAPEWQSGKYMWQRTTMTYADGHSNTPVTTCIAGAAGKSIVVNTTTYSYCNSTNGTSHPSDSATWTQNPNPEAGKYIWTKIITTYKFEGTSTSAGSSTTYTVSYTGTNGGTGPQGVSVSSITPLYYLKTVAPTGDAPNAPTTLPITNTSPNADAWTKVMPTYTNTGVYYTCDQIGFSNSTYSTSMVVADEGLNKAIVAADSSIVSTSIEYAVGSSTSDPPTTGWTSTTSTLNVGINQYLWTRLKNVLKNGNTQYSDERCLATQKKDLDRQYMEYVLSANEDNAPSSGWGISKPSAYISETPYLWVRTAFVYKIIGGTTISEVTEYKNTMVDKTWNQIFNIDSSLKDTQDEIAAAMKTGTVRIEGGNIIVANKTENPDNFIIINSKGIAFYSNNGGWIDSKFIEDNPTQISSTWNIDGTLNMQNINVINLAANSIANQNLVLGSQESTGDLDIYDRTNHLMFETVTTNDGLIEGFKIYKRRLNQDNSFTDLGYIYLSREKGFQEFDNNGNQIFGNNGSNYFASRINRTNQQIITNKTPEQSTSGEYGIQMIPMSVNNAGDSLTHIGVAFLKL